MRQRAGQMPFLNVGIQLVTTPSTHCVQEIDEVRSCPTTATKVPHGTPVPVEGSAAVITRHYYVAVRTFEYHAHAQTSDRADRRSTRLGYDRLVAELVNAHLAVARVNRVVMTECCSETDCDVTD